MNRDWWQWNHVEKSPWDGWGSHTWHSLCRTIQLQWIVIEGLVHTICPPLWPFWAANDVIKMAMELRMRMGQAEVYLDDKERLERSYDAWNESQKAKDTQLGKSE